MIGTALAMPAAASTPLRAYVEARAVEMSGDEARSARLFAAIAAADPADRTIARKAIGTAIQSGQAELAVSLARRIPPDELPIDARLMLAAETARKGQAKKAAVQLEKGTTSTEASLFAPLMKAWDATSRRKADGAKSLANLPERSPLEPIADEQRAAMLLALGRADEALPIATEVVSKGGGRETRLRLAFADALVKAGKRTEAMGMLAGDDEALSLARARLASGQSLGTAIDTPAKGYAEMLVALAVDLSRDDNKALPISLVQVARHADPTNSEAVILLALLQEADGRLGEALATLETISSNDLLAGEALDVEARILSDQGRSAAALARAQAAVRQPGAGAHSYRRLANVLGDMDRHAEAAAAYQQAIEQSGGKAEWTLFLLKAASLEQAGRWTDAKAALTTAMAMEPENPLLLNFLGYGKLERGEDLDEAEAMIRKASALRPDDASITDSLGWALYKRGRLAEAIDTLRRAAAGDPTQWEIHEHLGDALFAYGRRIEARFSWSAALLNAEVKAKGRIEQKLETGLNSANAAP